MARRPRANPNGPFDKDIQVLKKLKRSCQAIGPGLIIAAVVLGPGSVTAISANGSVMGTDLLWVVLLAGIFMLAYTMMSARFGAVREESFLEAIAGRHGRALAAVIGICAFLVSAGFQCGNNLGVAMAMEAIIGGATWAWAVLFTLLAMSFMFFFRSLYQALEKLMMGLVVLMLVAFVGNLVVAGPDLKMVAQGFVPSLSGFGEKVVAAIVATTFSVMAALFQSYLVQEKRRGGDTEVRDCMRDSLVGIATLTGISMVIMITSATVLYPRGIQVHSAADMAVQLEPLLGRFAKWLFAMGLWGASFSSFLGNAILGGTLLSDGLGMGRDMSGRPAKLFAAAIMLIGMTVAAVSSLSTGFSAVSVIIIAQAVTVIVVPLAAFMLLWLTGQRGLMGRERSGFLMKLIGGLGLLAVLLLAINTVRNLIS